LTVTGVTPGVPVVVETLVITGGGPGGGTVTTTLIVAVAEGVVDPVA
jgi:hypothetical protein